MSLLTVHLQPSKRLAAILGVAHLLVMGLLWPIALPILIKFVIFILLVISLLFTVRQYALLNTRRAIVAFELSNKMFCKFETRHGQSIICHILGSTFVSPYLVVLNLKPPDHFLTRSVVILQDSIDTELFRQLRVLLRWKWKDEIYHK